MKSTRRIGVSLLSAALSVAAVSLGACRRCHVLECRCHDRRVGASWWSASIRHALSPSRTWRYTMRLTRSIGRYRPLRPRPASGCECLPGGCSGGVNHVGPRTRSAGGKAHTPSSIRHTRTHCQSSQTTRPENAGIAVGQAAAAALIALRSSDGSQGSDAVHTGKRTRRVDPDAASRFSPRPLLAIGKRDSVRATQRGAVSAQASQIFRSDQRRQHRRL